MSLLTLKRLLNYQTLFPLLKPHLFRVLEPPSGDLLSKQLQESYKEKSLLSLVLVILETSVFSMQKPWDFELLLWTLAKHVGGWRRE